MRKVVCAVALAMAVLPAFSADLRLIVRNPSPFDLKDAPVSSGVPWPRGLLQSAENLRLVDRLGVEHPLQAEVLGRWPEGSVKWTLLDLQATVKKSSATTYTLQYGNGVQRATHGAEGLLVEENDRGYAVSTREATFWVRTTGFNLLDRVTLRGQKAPIVSEVAEEPRLRLVVAEEMARIEHPGGTPHVQLPAEDSVFMGRHDIGGQWFPLRGFRVLDAKTDQPLGMKVVGGSLDPTGKQRAVGHGWCEGLYLQLDKAPTQPITIIYPRRATTPEVYSAQLGPCRVAFETQGPVRTVIRASGRFQAPDGSSLCDYVARLHFYSGKPYVRLQLTVTNRENLPLSSGLAIYPLLVRDLSVSLPLALRGTQHFAISGRQGYGSSHRGTLVGPEDRARLVQYASRASRLSRYVVIHGEDRIATGHAAAGGIGLRDEAQGAVLCVRELWANNPKALRATGRGRIEAALFPEEAGPVDDFVAGRAKTHDILLLFHGEDVPSPVELSVAFDAEPTACLAAGATGGYRGLWAANALNHQVAPLTGSPYDRHFTSDFDELLRTREFTGSYGIWNHGAQGIYRQRVVDLIVRRASMGSVQAAGLVGLDGAVGMGLAIDSGSAVTLGRPEPVLVSSMERDQGIASFTRSLDPVPDRGARALLYDPWGAYLGHRYDVGYAIAREYLRRGEPALLHTARNAAFHLADVSTHHGIRGGGVEWIGACQDASRGRTEHHVPGLSHDASWYAGAWLTFLLSGDRALLHSALENAGSAARHADRDDVTVQAAALAILNLSYAADVAAATSPADARTFERALGAYIDKLLALQAETAHGLYGERVVEAALAFEALDMCDRRRKDPRIAASLERAARALIRPGAFWSGHGKVGRLRDREGNLFKPYGLADGLVDDRLRNPDRAIYGTVCQLVVPHLATVSERSGDSAFIKKARRLERVGTLFRCGSFDDFALRYRAGDRFVAQWEAHLRAHPPVTHDTITFQCRMENAADVALPDFGAGGSVVGTQFVALPDGSHAYQAQAPELARREGLGVWFPMAGTSSVPGTHGSLEFRICYRKGPARRLNPWILSGDTAWHGFHIRLRTEGLEFVGRVSGGPTVRLLAKGVTVEPGKWHHVAVSWRPTWGIDLFFDGRVVAHSQVDRVGFGRRLLLVCDPEDKTNEILIDDLRIWRKWLKAFPAATDRTPPAPITDLRFKRAAGGRLLLTWTAPGDDGAEGQAQRYDVRVSTQGFHPISWGGYPALQDPIAAVHWAEADRVSGAPTPKPPGQMEQFLIGPFPTDRRVYVAIRTEDEANVSALSNVIRTPVLHPPIAHLGASKRQVITGARVVFDASDSSDPDYDDLTYAWSDGAKGLTTEIPCDQPGQKTVELKVSDGTAISTAKATIAVGDMIRVNFQPRGLPAPAGFVPCYGQSYTRARGQGWVSYDASPMPFVRHKPSAVPIQARTGIRFPLVAEWRLDLPNGAYTVDLSIGDPAHLDGHRRLFAEGKPLFDTELTARKEPVTAKALEVVVADGQLNIHVGTPSRPDQAVQPGGELNYIVVRRLPDTR